MEQYNSIQQLLKKEGGKKNPVFPPTVIQAVFDAKTGASLEAILAQFNSVYLQYQGTPQATRLIIPKEMRRAGLTITYMNMDSETITERAVSAVQKDNDHWGLDINWSRVDELTLSGDISVSVKGTWIINGSDTGVKAVGPKGDAGITPWLKTIDNRLHVSYDNVNWEPCSEPISAYFRWSSNKIQISRDNKTWTDLSGTFADNVHIKGYVATTSALPSSAAQGDIYGVGPTYAAEDTAHTNPIYRLYVRNANTWVDNGSFTSIAAGIVQEPGDSENAVMSQKAVTAKLSELGSEVNIIVGSNREEVSFVLKENHYWNYDYIEDTNLNCTEPISVNAGEIIIVTGNGGKDGRLFFLLNSEGTVILRANQYSNVAAIFVEENGTIICNTYKTGALKIERVTSSDSALPQILEKTNSLSTDLQSLKRKQPYTIGSLIFTQGEAIPDVYKNVVLEFDFYATEELTSTHENFKVNSFGWYESTKRSIFQIVANPIGSTDVAYFAIEMETNVDSIDSLRGVKEYNEIYEQYGAHVVINFDALREYTSGAINDTKPKINPILLDDNNKYLLVENNRKSIASILPMIEANSALLFENIVKTSKDLSYDMYYPFNGYSVGDTYNGTPVDYTTPSGTWGCIKIGVYKGTIIELSVRGGSNGRAYALTDSNKKILQLAEAGLNTLGNPIIIKVEKDGFLYVNQNTPNNELFSIKLKKNNIQPVIDIVLNRKSYDKTALTSGYYYYLGNLTEGNIVPKEPVFYGEGKTWGCIRLDVTQGSTVTLRVKGGSNGRAYALTDLDRRIKTIAEAGLNTLDAPTIIDIEVDGYLYVNQNGADEDSFSIIVDLSIDKKIDSLSNRLEEAEKNKTTAPRMFNPILNLKKDKLRVLDIGNSYTVDSTHYLPNLIDAAGIDTSDMCLYTAVRGGASFKNWYDIYHDRDSYGYSITKNFGGLTADILGSNSNGVGEKFRNTLINNKWDLIIIHQVSSYAPYYEKWEEDDAAGYLSKFIRLLRKHQPQATIGFLLVHSYWSGFGSNSEGSSYERWYKIAQSAKELRANYGIDFIIPYGTAIQNIRASSLNTEHDLTNDGTHCANGLADYTAACAYFQSLIAPRYDVSVLGNPYRVTVEQTGTYPESEVSVTDDNAPIAQKAAFIACYNWYECINPEEMEL